VLKVVDNGYSSKLYQDAFSDALKRIAGITERELAEDELLAYISVFDILNSNLKARIRLARRKRGHTKLLCTK